MSNNTNLSKLANVLDDGSDGQYLKSTGSGGVVFDTVAARTTTVADITALEALTAAQGDMAFVLSNNNVYIRKTAGWYKIANVTNNQLESVTVTMSGGGTAGDPYLLALDGTDTLATGAATDPEGLSVTWSAAAISPTTLSGNNIVVSSVNVATITQGTDASSNVFTIDPVATTGTHNFSLRFSVTDGINATINADKDYILSFITTIADSKYTTLLAQAVGANNGTNSSITDSHSSSSPHTVTVSGTPAAGTFSPYRSGGYSTYFDGTTDYIEHQGTFTLPSGTNANWTIECWVNLDQVNLNQGILRVSSTAASGNNDDIYFSEQSGDLRAGTKAGGINSGTSAFAMTANTWHHIAMVKNNGTIYLYNNGVYCGSLSDSNDYSGSYYVYGGLYYSSTYCFAGYLTDFRISNTAKYTSGTSNFTVSDERLDSNSSTLFLTCHLPYIADGSTNNHTITINGNVSTKPFSPYDSKAYNAAANGGSIYFDGTSDNRVSVAHDASLNPSGAWTIECWFYLTDTTDWASIFGKFDNATSNRSYHFRINADGSGRVIMSSAGSASDKGYTFTPTSGAFTAGQWYHFAQVYDGSGTYKYYVNGVAQTDYSWSGTPYAGSADFLIGTWQNGSTYYGDLNKAYVSDLRLVIGTAVYSGASLTVPTEPLGNITNTKLLVKGTDAAIIDKSGSTSLKLVGAAKCTTTAVVYNSNTVSSKSMYFDGSGDYLTAKDLPDIGNSDFTFETWMYETSHDANATLFDLRASGGNGYNLISNSGTLKWQYGGGTAMSAGSALSTNTWYHIALCRQGSSTKMFVNGSQTGSTYTDTNNYVAGTDRPIFAGNGYNTSAGYYTGYLQDIRLSVGKARYTSNFSVPTAPLEG